MKLKLFNKNVRVVLTDGEIFEGLFEEYYEEDNTVIINGIELNIDEIKEMEELKWFAKSNLKWYNQITRFRNFRSLNCAIFIDSILSKYIKSRMLAVKG